MFYMLSSFDLKPEQSISEFQNDLQSFTELLIQHDLILDCGPVGKRELNTILDTDEERSQEYYVLMTFRDKAQSDKAVKFIYQKPLEETAIHPQLYSRADNMIFTCWEDIT